MTQKTDERGQFLQGLIQISAGMIKWRLGNSAGMEKLFQEGVRRLQTVKQKNFMGLDLEAHLIKIKHFRKTQVQEDYPFIKCPHIPSLAGQQYK